MRLLARMVGLVMVLLLLPPVRAAQADDPPGAEAPTEAAPLEDEPEAELPPEYRPPDARHYQRYIQDLGDAEAKIRGRAVRGLRALKSSSAVSPLLKALRADPHAGVRARIAAALAEDHRRAALKDVLRLVQPDLPGGEALALLEFLNRCSETEAMRCAAVLFLHQAKAVSSGAKRILVAHRKSSVPVLTEVGAKLRGASRISVVDLLGEIGDKRATTWLATLMLSEEEVDPARDAARNALRKVGLIGAPAMIDVLLRTNSRNLCKVLNEITDTWWGVDSVKLWKRWLLANRDRIDQEEQRRFPQDFEPEKPPEEPAEKEVR